MSSSSTNTAAHTPGPWVDGERHETKIDLGHIGGYTGEVWTPICTVRGSLGMGDVMRANARLIAAAPELLEALEIAMTAQFDGQWKGKAAAAIAKAKGKA